MSWILKLLENKAPITIDFSANFEKGHEWKLDFWYEYDYPHKIYFDKVVYRESPPHLEVHYGTDNDINYIQLYCFSDVAPLCKGCPYSSTEGVFRIGLAEKPSGQLKLGLYSVSREIEPPEGWTIDFTLDELHQSRVAALIRCALHRARTTSVRACFNAQAIIKKQKTPFNS